MLQRVQYLFCVIAIIGWRLLRDKDELTLGVSSVFQQESSTMPVVVGLSKVLQQRETSEWEQCTYCTTKTITDTLKNASLCTYDNRYSQHNGVIVQR